MHIEFFKATEALIADYPKEPEYSAIRVPENVQLTYEELRSTDTGYTIAQISVRGIWVRLSDLTHWSDIVIRVDDD